MTQQQGKIAMRRPAKGTEADGGKIQIGLKFEPALFARILTIAQENRMSFAAQVRALLASALPTADSSSPHTEL